MKKASILLATLLLLLLTMSSYSQSSLDKWQKAIINIECHEELSKSIWEEIASHTITYQAALQKYPVNVGTGTAIFLKYENSYYLITAKHVLFDQSKGKIFYKIILIPSVDNYSEYIKSPPILMNLSSGGSIGQSFLFSEKFDLAILSLDYPGKGTLFTQRLLALGYEPISIDDIAFEDSGKVGDDIVCLGFPAATSIKKEYPTTIEARQWEVNYATLPVVSFGKIAQYHQDLKDFLGDISVYPGNSGGPVLHNNKLIGIVSSQPMIKVESINKNYADSISVRIPFGYFQKAGALKQLIQQMKQKHDYFIKFMHQSN